MFSCPKNNLFYNLFFIFSNLFLAKIGLNMNNQFCIDLPETPPWATSIYRGSPTYKVFTTADPTIANFGLYLYTQVGDFHISRGAPTVPLMQILRNTVQKSVSMYFRPRGIWKLHYNITRISPNWPINIWIFSQTSNFGPPNMKLHNQIYSKDICLCLIQGISIDPSHVSLVKPLPLTPCNLKLEDETQHIFSKQS